MNKRWQNRIFWLAAAGMAVSLGIAAAPVTWHLMGELADQPPPLSALAAAAPSAQPDTLSGILGLSPFGTPVGQAQPAPDRPAVNADLGLSLLGVAVAVPAAASRAIIAGGDKPVSGYAIGDAVTATITLSEVQADHVILIADGQPTVLYFAEALSGGATGIAALPTQSATVSGQSGTDEDADAVIASYRARIQQNPQTVIDSLGLQATDQGYLITPSAHPGVRQAGFRPGDIVTSVNGKAVGNVAQDTVYFDEIAAAGRASVEVLRDGQSIIMTFPLR